VGGEATVKLTSTRTTGQILVVSLTSGEFGGQWTVDSGRCMPEGVAALTVRP
jgi:hypothetical protein